MKVKNNLLKSIVILAMVGFVAMPAMGQEPGKPKTVKSAIDDGLKWLRSEQKEDGSWEHDVGITSLVVTSFAKSPRKYREEDGPFIRKAVKFILDSQKEDGGIYEMHLAAYNTSVALMALAAIDNASYEENIDKARRFLIDLQCDEGEDYSREDKFYGGIGYGGDLRPDLSNLQMALEALKESGTPEDSPVWDNAIVFLQRCQNRSESNDQSWAGDDGGFVYYPGHSMSDGTDSYGSMTYAGIKSYIYAGLSKDDPRFKAAYEWATNHYTLEENPGMDAQGLYYYYQLFAKTFAILGERTVVDGNGIEHDWYADLSAKLIDLQNPEGYWVNEESNRWWESNKVLVTSYSLLALEQGYERYK